MSTMFRATRSAQFIFRGSITSKRGDKNFYKGRGAPSMGYFAKHGKYLIDREKYAKQTFSVPSLKNFKLKPYIAVHTPKRQVPRPKMIVKIDFHSKIKAERASRIAKMAELKPLFNHKYKGPDAKKEYQRLRHGLELFNEARRNHAQRAIARAETRAKKLKIEQAKAAKQEKWANLDKEVKEFFTVVKPQDPKAEMSKEAQYHYEQRHARKFYEFIKAKTAKYSKKNINTIKKAAVQQQAV